ncbi:MAG: BtrH N-terminal domain-containing protein [Chloroflexi bacterium]|nr:BtrH N-terminal domain-containing protein [Chloroflexota bacterium]
MAELANYHHFDGLPWATGYLVNALGYQGVTAPHTGQPYSEALLMGINGGLCAGYFSFEYTGELPHLHFLTRYLFDEEPGKVFERLAIPMRVQQTTDSTKAAANVINALAQGKPAIVWGDVLSLPYNSFAPGAGYWLIMPVLVYGYDSVGEVKIADRARVGLTASAADLSVARAKIGKVKNRMMTIGAPNPDKLTHWPCAKAFRPASTSCCTSRPSVTKAASGWTPIKNGRNCWKAKPKTVGRCALRPVRGCTPG